jgi:hypothetical protein
MCKVYTRCARGRPPAGRARAQRRSAVTRAPSLGLALARAGRGVGVGVGARAASGRAPRSRSGESAGPGSSPPPRPRRAPPRGRSRDPRDGAAPAARGRPGAGLARRAGTTACGGWRERGLVTENAYGTCANVRGTFCACAHMVPVAGAVCVCLPARVRAAAFTCLRWARETTQTSRARARERACRITRRDRERPRRPRRPARASRDPPCKVHSQYLHLNLNY